MIDISVTNLVKEFEVGTRLLDRLSFQIDTGERVGLLGPNGCGKTTLLKILTGSMDYDEGEVVLAAGKKLGLISQIPVYPDGYTVEDVLATAFVELHRMEGELAELASQMGEDPSLLERYDRLMTTFETSGGYEMATRTNKVCNGLSISQPMREQLFDSLSGGEKTRVNLARLILEDTDILLLDEPTNHLDLNATEWLEGYLEQFKGTVLTVSHDRYFLDRVVGRIIEIQHGKAEFYAGNYTFYAVEKEQRYLTQLKQYEKEQAKIAQLEATARVMHEHGTERMHKQAFAMEKRIERIRQTQRPTGRTRAITVRFGEKEFRGDEMFTLKGITKSFGERTLFSGLGVEVTGGERIALIGDNGSGKSTLLKILLGEEQADQGKIRFGPTVKMGYLPQHVHFSHPERNLVDTLIYEQDCTAQTARNRLGSFQFRGEDVLKPVSALSGGEQSRLKLCMLMDEKINLLILDEPTNHLDIQSREWIEQAVEEFEGNLLFVSHDRYFIDRFASRIWLLEHGYLTDFRGNYEEFQAARAKGTAGRAISTIPIAKEPVTAVKEKKEKPKRTGGTKQLEKEVNAAERAITKIEEQMEQLERQIEESASDYMKLQELCGQKELLEGQLQEQYDLWEQKAAELEEARQG